MSTRVPTETHATQGDRADPLREINGILQPYARPELARPLLIFAIDIAVLAGLTWASLHAGSLWIRVLLAPFQGLAIALLFVVGHDACHGSFTSRRWLNQWIGRLAFLPSLHSYSLWAHGHNRIHHRYTNVRSVDYVFRPLDPSEYAALPPLRRWLYRIDRSAWGHGVYYLRIWLTKMVLPLPRREYRPKATHWFDGALVIGFAMVAISVLARSHGAAGVLWGFAVPFLLWNHIMGFVIYLHHTEPGSKWYGDHDEWSFAEAQLGETVHVRFPRWINWLIHNILEHTAHHLKTSIPLYRLAEAQEALERALPEKVKVVDWSLATYLDSVRRCKLYDYGRHLWVGFEKNRTSSATTRL